MIGETVSAKCTSPPVITEAFFLQTNNDSDAFLVYNLDTIHGSSDDMIRTPKASVYGWCNIFCINPLDQ